MLGLRKPPRATIERKQQLFPTGRHPGSLFGVRSSLGAPAMMSGIECFRPEVPQERTFLEAATDGEL